MTLLARVMVGLEAVYASVAGEALKAAERLLTPAGPIPRETIARLLRRALRNGAWRTLPREERALLYAASRTRVRVYRSPGLLNLLRRIWLHVELATVRGRAVLAALTHLLAQGARDLGRLLRRGLDSLLALGVQLLNHPTIRTAVTV